MRSRGVPGGRIYFWNDALIERQLGNAPASRALALLHATLYDASLAVAAAKAAHPRQPPVAEDAAPAVPGARARGPSYPFETAAMGAAAVAVLGGILPA